MWCGPRNEEKRSREPPIYPMEPFHELYALKMLHTKRNSSFSSCRFSYSFFASFVVFAVAVASAVVVGVGIFFAFLTLDFS